jgi:hypothetical protein
MERIMKKVRLLSFIILILGILLGNSAIAREFSLADVSGQYAFVYNGTITVTDPTTGQAQSIPTSAVGQIVASGADTDGDGLGEATATSVMNIGGFAILSFASTSQGSTTYTVDSSTGLGTASAPVVLTAQPELPLGLDKLPPGLDVSKLSGTVVFDFKFVIDKAGAFDVIGTKLSTQDSAGQTTPIGASVGRGIAKSQESNATQ